MPSRSVATPGLASVSPVPRQSARQELGDAPDSPEAAWFRLWTTALGLAFLTGRPLPAPPLQLRAAAIRRPRRAERALASATERLTSERAAALRGCYEPATLARAMFSAASRLLAGQPAPAAAGQVWVIPQLRWAHEAARAGWGADGMSPDDLAPPLDFALAGLPDWPGITAGQRLRLLLRHRVALTAPENRALAAIALFGADGRDAFSGALATELTLIFPEILSSSRTPLPGSPSGGAVPTGKNSSHPHHLDHGALSEAMRMMECPGDWLATVLRWPATG
jgi:hypothetical protein